MNLLSAFGHTDVGQRRTDNQDTFICAPLWRETSLLVAVIDGVGGYAGGDRAATIARESIERYMITPVGHPLAMLQEAVLLANNQIDEQRQAEARLSQMCCVLTTAVADLESGRLYFVHVGDTRLYRYRRGVLEKLTADHSMVGIREDAGQLSEEEAMRHPLRNEIMRDVGSTHHRLDDPDFMDFGEADFQRGDQLLLCSDGLTDMITREQITSVLRKSSTVDEKTAALIQLANNAGGKDNITVVLVNAAGESTHLPINSTELPKASSHKRTEPVILPVEPDLPETEPPVNTKTKSSRQFLFGLIGTVIALGLVAIYISLFPPEKQASTKLGKDSTNNSAKAKITSIKGLSRVDSLITQAHRQANNVLTFTKRDTVLILQQPLDLNDSLLVVLSQASRPTLIMPADTIRSYPAFRITTKKKVRLENLTIKGFKTPIQASETTKLVLRNVKFLQADQPIAIMLPGDTLLTTELIIVKKK